MNHSPNLTKLKPYPFERLRALLGTVTSDPALKPVNLSIGEPKHPTPELIKQALINNLDGLATYPSTLGIPELRESISRWIKRRFDAQVDAGSQILPILGSREALFAFAQVVLDGCESGSLLAYPNPFYQIYEGAAFLGNAKPHCMNIKAETGLPDLKSVSPDVLKNVRLMYVCSPNNPTGTVMGMDDWQTLFDLADEYDFVIGSDECYSEIYLDEANPPIGGLEAASRLGRSDYNNLIVFSSLSKRSNAPGLRSGYVAGDAEWIAKFLKYRTYHGSAMSVTIQKASIAAWDDEDHVIENRRLYKEKFDTLYPMLKDVMGITMPPAGFYFWANTGRDDAEFVRDLYKEQHVTLLPGSYLGREQDGVNPGSQHVRIALVAPLAECVEAANRIKTYLSGQ